MSQIAELNDALRRNPSCGHWHITQGVQTLPLSAGDLFRTIKDYESFTQGSDPYGEHDFGVPELAGERLFWKIDYYDTALEYHSLDPANPELTARVLTVMLASEY